MARIVADHPWSSVVGPIDSWPAALRTAVSMVLRSKLPMLLMWGDSRICFYNDALCDGLALDDQHSSRLGLPIAAISKQRWQSAWPVVDRIRDIHETIWQGEVRTRTIAGGEEEEIRWSVFLSAVPDGDKSVAGRLLTCVPTAVRTSSFPGNPLSEVTDIPAILWMTDPTGYCTYLNKNWYEFTAQQEHEALGYGWLDATHPDDKEMSADIFMKANADHKPFRIVYRLRRGDGQYRWCADTGQPRFSASGEYEGMIGTVVDVHEERVMTEKLRNISAHLQLATDASDAGTWQLDVQRSSLTWSDYHKKMWGYDPEAQGLVYEDWHRPIFAEDREEAFRRVALALETHEQYEAVYRIRRANDGEVRWMKSLGRYDYDANGMALTLTGITIDITDERNALEAIRQNEQKFRLLAEKLPQIIWVDDAYGNSDYRSSRWDEYFGEGEANSSWIERVHTQDRERAEGEWQQGKSNESPFQVEVRLRNRNGQYRWHRSVGEPIKDDQGRVVKWVGALIDIHDMKTLEDQLNELVLKRTSELARSNEDLQQFAHVASHDLKEPVRKVKTFISRLFLEFKDQLPEKVVDYLSRIDKASDRMRAMIDGVLDFSMVNAGQIAHELVELPEVLKKISEDLELLIADKRARIIFERLHPLQATPILMYQLFYNLVANSLKFSRPGVPPVISISTQQIATTGSESNPSRPAVRIIYTDNGIGFPNAHAEDIFRPFVRLQSKDKYEGTGLGLALCRKIVERHGGTIRADGTENAGARFIIELPS